MLLAQGSSHPEFKCPITQEILKKNFWAANCVLAEGEAALMREVFSLAFHACTCIGEKVTSNGRPQHAVLAQNVTIRAREVSIVFHTPQRE